MENKVILILLTIIIITNIVSADTPKYSSSINFYGEKTDVYMGEEILAKLSIINLISSPKMTAQVIILPSSGMSVTSAEFTKISAGQFAANYEIDPGQSLPIIITLRANQVGEFNIKGRVVYYFGDDKQDTQDYILDLPVSVRKPTVLTDVDTKSYQPKKGSVGFEIVLIGIGIIAFIIIFSVALIYMLKRH